MLFTEGLKVTDDVYSIDFTRTLPPAFKNDPNMLALGKVIAEGLQKDIRLTQKKKEGKRWRMRK
jgi:hypothetical protein